MAEVAAQVDMVALGVVRPGAHAFADAKACAGLVYDVGLYGPASCHQVRNEHMCACVRLLQPVSARLKQDYYVILRTPTYTHPTTATHVTCANCR